jgi:hypothetical protein
MQAVDALAAALNLAHTWNQNLAELMRDAPLASPTPGTGNHPHWVVGHLACSNTSLLTMMDGRDNAIAAWEPLFLGGSTPRPDGRDYPEYDDVLDRFNQSHHDARALLDELGEAGLDRKPSIVWPQLVDDPDFKSAGRLLNFLALHAMSHRGQLADAARAAGKL